MNFFILRRGQKLGPYPDGAIEEMSASGELKAGDLVCYEGEQNWQPVSRFLEHRQQRAEAGGAEAGGAQADVADVASAPVPSKTTFLRRSVEEMDEATLTDAEREVIAGGRFLVFEHCWSLLISFKHTTKPILMRAGEDSFGQAFRHSLISCCFGWWGIPGPVWVISTIRHNARGGRDATLETLTRQVGHARAAAACAQHQTSAPPSGSMRALGLMMTGLSLALWLSIGWLVWAVAQGHIGEPARGPGTAEFELADRRVTEAQEGNMLGGTLKDIELAYSFAQTFGDAYLAEARARPEAAVAGTNAPVFTTFCEVHQDRVIFLVRVPGLQKASAAIRRQLADRAWNATSVALTKQRAGFTGLRVALGVRSAGKYDQVLAGRYVRDFEINNTGLKSRSEGPRSKAKLYPFFVPLEQLESLND